jgi:hypothetical protein
MEKHGDYSKEWGTSSRRLSELGFYRDLTERYDFRGSSVLELGVGLGEEAKAIWGKSPGCLLGIDKNTGMLYCAREKLKKSDYPVNLIESRKIPEFHLKKGFINIALADYCDFLSFDAALAETFDTAILTFRSCSEQTISQSLDSPQETIYPFLKDNGRFIYIDRCMNLNPERSVERLEAPQGYTLEKAFFEEKPEIRECL